MLAFETSEVRDVYEVKVPKVRMLRTGGRSATTGLEVIADEQVRAGLRLQITEFWKGIKDYLNELVSAYGPYLMCLLNLVMFVGGVSGRQRELSRDCA
jgi:hypothetical protein